LTIRAASAVFTEIGVARSRAIDARR